MNKIYLALIALLITACSGTSAYTVKPIIIDGKKYCCELDVNNSKDIDSIDASFEQKADGSIKLVVKQKGVKTNAAVAAENQGKLLDAVTSIIPKGK